MYVRPVEKIFTKLYRPPVYKEAVFLSIEFDFDLFFR